MSQKHPYDLRGRAQGQPQRRPPADEPAAVPGIGEVVRLRSGGLPMTVTALGDHLALCEWHAETGEPCQDWYVYAALEAVAP